MCIVPLLHVHSLFLHSILALHPCTWTCSFARLLWKSSDFDDPQCSAGACVWGLGDIPELPAKCTAFCGVLDCWQFRIG